MLLEDGDDSGVRDAWEGERREEHARCGLVVRRHPAAEDIREEQHAVAPDGEQLTSGSERRAGREHLRRHTVGEHREAARHERCVLLCARKAAARCADDRIQAAHEANEMRSVLHRLQATAASCALGMR